MATADEQVYSAAVEASSNAPIRRKRRAAAKDSGSSMKRVPSNLHNFEQLPEYLRDNEFIMTGYRYTMPMKDTWRSLFNIHNETGNIYSHLLGAYYSLCWREFDVRQKPWWLHGVARACASSCHDDTHMTTHRSLLSSLSDLPSFGWLPTAGFILFVCITVWVTKSPPTPLAFSRPQLDQLWHSVRGNLQQLGGSVGENLQHLQDSLPNLQSLQDNLHHIQDSLNSGVSSLQVRGMHSSKTSALLRCGIWTSQWNIHWLCEWVGQMTSCKLVACKLVAVSVDALVGEAAFEKAMAPSFAKYDLACTNNARLPCKPTRPTHLPLSRSPAGIGAPTSRQRPAWGPGPSSQSTGKCARGVPACRQPVPCSLTPGRPAHAHSGDRPELADHPLARVCVLCGGHDLPAAVILLPPVWLLPGGGWVNTHVCCWRLLQQSCSTPAGLQDCRTACCT